MGHGNYQNLSIIVSRQLYAYGKISIDQAIKFCLKNIQKYQDMIDRFAYKNTQMSEEEFGKTPQYQKWSKQRDMFAWHTSEENYTDECNLGSGIDTCFRHFYDQGIIEPIPTDTMPLTKIQQYIHAELDPDGEYDNVLWQFTKDGYRSYREKTLPHLGYQDS